MSSFIFFIRGNFVGEKENNMEIRTTQSIILQNSLTETYDFIVSGQLASTFLGYGNIPGIKRIDFTKGSYDIEGSEAIVYNTDGSIHNERILTVKHLKEIELEAFGGQGVSAKLLKRTREVVKVMEIDEKTTELTQTFIFELKSPLYAPLIWFASKTNFKKAMDIQQAEIQSRLS